MSKSPNLDFLTLLGLLRAGDPRQEVWFAWNAKEIVRQIYDHTDADLAVEWVAEIGRDFTDREMPPDVRRLGRTITRWAAPICAWHRSHVTNGPTEAVNNLAKRIKRVAFGLVNFRPHQVRCLLYAGKPDWTLLPTIQPCNAKRPFAETDPVRALDACRQGYVLAQEERLRWGEARLAYQTVGLETLHGNGRRAW